MKIECNANFFSIFVSCGQKIECPERTAGESAEDEGAERDFDDYFSQAWADGLLRQSIVGPS